MFDDYINFYQTQSQNSSAKICIIIENLLKSELNAQENPHWNQLETENIFVSHQAFIFHQRSFYFRMLFKTVNSLIDTGIIKHLTDDYLRKKKFFKIEEQTKVLSLNDLSFGFIIWLCFCGISFGAFILEMTKKHKPKKVPKLFKFAKVHPYVDNCCSNDENLKKKNPKKHFKNSQLSKIVK